MEFTNEQLQMLMMMMDAKKGNTNVSGVLNNLDSGFLSILSGAYDPRTAESSQSANQPFLNKYAQSEDPLVQDILSKLSQGYDKYQLSSYIDSLDAQGQNISSFQTGDLKRLANEFYKEYTGTGSGGYGGSNTSVTDKVRNAGLPDPTELYDINTVPLDSANLKRIKSIQDRVQKETARYGDVSYNEGVARRNLDRGSSATEEGKRISKEDILQWIGQESGKGRGALGLNRVSSYFKNNKDVKDINKTDLSALLKKSGAESLKYSSSPKQDARGFEQATKNIMKKTGTARGVGTNRDAVKAWEQAMHEKALMETVAVAGAQREQAVREGQLQRAAQNGQTPTSDALKQSLAFLAMMK
jgi:hypothetical protein